MPIHRKFALRCISDQEFTSIDEAVMRCAYAAQNHFGRLFDERIYENDMAERLRAEGMDVHTQVPVKLSHDGFEKTYLLDLVVNQMLYELKVTSALLPEHDAQALNYAMLQNVPLAKLINFGEAKVHGKLLRNALLESDRHSFKMNRVDFTSLSPRCIRLSSMLESVVSDWGTHLDFSLYNEALTHFFGGESVVRRIDLWTGPVRLGTHLVRFHDARVAFVVTGFSDSQQSYKRHLEILLQHADLRDLEGVQWINLNRSSVELITLTR